MRGGVQEVLLRFLNRAIEQTQRVITRCSNELLFMLIPFNTTNCRNVTF